METMKVNVAFQLVVPIRKDPNGRKLSIIDQVSPYISDYFSDLHTTMRIEKHHNYGPCKRGCEIFNYDAQDDLDLVERMEHCKPLELMADMRTEESRIRWEKQKDLECWELFKMTWKEFKTLSWTEQVKMREQHGVVWENNGWVKKGK